MKMTKRFLFKVLSFLVFSYANKFCVSHSEFQDLANHPGHLKRYGSQGPLKEVEETGSFPKASKFFEKYVATNTPVIFKGAVKDSKPYREWTDEYFLALSIPEDDRVKVQGQRGVFDMPEIHFHEFVRTYNQTNEYMETVVPPYLG